MKKNLNVIQINGARGILMVVGFICCAAAGFIWFPGWVATNLWNFAAKSFSQMPVINIVQGILLWGIIVASYHTFKKEKLVVCMKASDGLSEEELKKVFADIKKQTSNDALIYNMLRAREAELKIKNLGETSIPKVDKRENNKIESK